MPCRPPPSSCDEPDNVRTRGGGRRGAPPPRQRCVSRARVAECVGCSPAHWRGNAAAAHGLSEDARGVRAGRGSRAPATRPSRGGGTWGRNARPHQLASSRRARACGACHGVRVGGGGQAGRSAPPPSRTPSSSPRRQIRRPSTPTRRLRTRTRCPRPLTPLRRPTRCCRRPRLGGRTPCRDRPRAPTRPRWCRARGQARHALHVVVRSFCCLH